MRLRCVNRPFRDLSTGTLYVPGDEFDGDAAKMERINSAGYGVMAEAVADAPDYMAMTVAQLREALAERGAEIPTKARKADLVAMLEGE